jgi:hypothetical protein
MKNRIREDWAIHAGRRHYARLVSENRYRRLHAASWLTGMGKTGREIAEMLSVSIRTVRRDRAAIRSFALRKCRYCGKYLFPSPFPMRAICGKLGPYWEEWSREKLEEWNARYKLRINDLRLSNARGV